MFFRSAGRYESAVLPEGMLLRSLNTVSCRGAKFFNHHHNTAINENPMDWYWISVDPWTIVSTMTTEKSTIGCSLTVFFHGT
jgi:hypothetical protein